MTASTSEDPFEQFAKAMSSTEEVVDKLAKEEPPRPPDGPISIGEAIDAYVDWEQYAKKRKAAESAYTKTRNEFYQSMIDSALRASPFAARVPGEIVRGNKHAVQFLTTAKPEFDEAKLREMDIKYSATHTAAGGVPPVDGLTVKYTANPDRARNSDIEAELRSAIVGWTESDKLKVIPFGGETK